MRRRPGAAISPPFLFFLFPPLTLFRYFFFSLSSSNKHSVDSRIKTRSMPRWSAPPLPPSFFPLFPFLFTAFFLVAHRRQTKKRREGIESARRHRPNFPLLFFPSIFISSSIPSFSSFRPIPSKGSKENVERIVSRHGVSFFFPSFPPPLFFLLLRSPPPPPSSFF